MDNRSPVFHRLGNRLCGGWHLPWHSLSNLDREGSNMTVCNITAADFAGFVVLGIVVLAMIPLIVLDGARLVRQYRKRRGG